MNAEYFRYFFHTDYCVIFCSISTSDKILSSFERKL